MRRKVVYEPLVQSRIVGTNPLAASSGEDAAGAAVVFFFDDIVSGFSHVNLLGFSHANLFR